jgi:hypothetical protein
MNFWVDCDGVTGRHGLTELKPLDSHSDSCKHIINSWLSSVHLLVRIGILQTKTSGHLRGREIMGLLLVVSVVYIRLWTIACLTQKVTCCFLYVV